jgi:hypothetical protein
MRSYGRLAPFLLSQPPFGTLQGLRYRVVVGVMMLVRLGLAYGPLEVFTACGP